ncbi:MAG: hypothetical protein Q4E75_02205 [bacterium]|nr:hypothetical protein [bacterium]
MFKIYKYENIDKTKLYKDKMHFNSTLYYDKNIFYKIPYYKDEEMVSKLVYLNNCNIRELIKILGIIKDGKETVGYAFLNYNKNYCDLKSIQNRSLNNKYKDCKSLIKIFNKFLRYDICYFDCHLGNILINLCTNDMKICDIDDIVISKDKNLKIDMLRCLATLFVSYLYDIPKNDVSGLLRGNNYIFNSNGNINKYFSVLSSGYLIDFNYVLENLDLNLIEYEKEDMKPKLFELNKRRFRI